MQVVLEVASQVYVFSEMFGNKGFSYRNLRKKVKIAATKPYSVIH